MAEGAEVAAVAPWRVPMRSLGPYLWRLINKLRAIHLLLQHRFGIVKISKLLRSVLASHLYDDLVATRMSVQKAGNVVHHSIYDDPAALRGVVLSNLISGEATHLAVGVWQTFR